jgi:transcriptional regulator GlxA family with amidase domain
LLFGRFQKNYPDVRIIRGLTVVKSQIVLIGGVVGGIALLIILVVVVALCFAQRSALSVTEQSVRDRVASVNDAKNNYAMIYIHQAT